MSSSSIPPGMTPYDPLASTEGYPYLHELCNDLRKKYSLPLYYVHNSSSNDGGKPPLPKGLYEDFGVIFDEAYKTLKETFPQVITNSNNFIPQTIFGEYPQTKPNFNSWFGKESAPAPHYGNPGCQWYWEMSPPGEMQRKIRTLCKAYMICVKELDEQTKLKERLLIQEKERKQKETEEFLERQKCNEKKRKIEEYFENIGFKFTFRHYIFDYFKNTLASPIIKEKIMLNIYKYAQREGITFNEAEKQIRQGLREVLQQISRM